MKNRHRSTIRISRVRLKRYGAQRNEFDSLRERSTIRISRVRLKRSIRTPQRAHSVAINDKNLKSEIETLNVVIWSRVRSCRSTIRISRVRLKLKYWHQIAVSGLKCRSTIRISRVRLKLAKCFKFCRAFPERSTIRISRVRLKHYVHINDVCRAIGDQR